MKKIMIYLICLMISTGGLLLTQSQRAMADDQMVNENDLFSNSDTVVSQDNIVNNNVGDELKEKHIGFSGEIDASTTFSGFSPAEDWTGLGSQGQIQLLNQIGANFLVDIRLKEGIKGFLSTGVGYYPALPDAIKSQLGLQNNTALQINEFFVDTNWKQKVYCRTGKQVLQWGTSYFWNPTDLINIDRKDFLDMSKVRGGTFGTKIQIPSGVQKNVYFFLGMNDAQKLDDLFLAGKYEFLVGKTEMSVSVLTQGGRKPVYGYDFTSRLGDIDLRGEVGLLPNDDNRKIMNYDTLAVEDEVGDWNTRTSLGFTKYFDNGDIKDRISVTGEFYYNSAGYEKNIFQQILDIDPSKKTTFYTQVYQPYMNSKYYLAFFSSVQKFIKPEITLNINGISNLVDHSATLTTGITYSPALTDLTIDCHLNGYFGAANTEATFSGNSYSIYLGTRILF